jgi:acyl-CoA dehydrogenase
MAYTRERVQFGRSLSTFQSVQHALATMAGEIERGRAAATLAVASAVDHGFGSAHSDYAITVAKITLGRVVPTVTTIAHQLHGAIGVTQEHHLWSFTMRAQSWIDEFGATAGYAQRLGRLALAADDPWSSAIGSDLTGWQSINSLGVS